MSGLLTEEIEMGTTSTKNRTARIAEFAASVTKSRVSRKLIAEAMLSCIERGFEQAHTHIAASGPLTASTGSLHAPTTRQSFWVFDSRSDADKAVAIIDAEREGRVSL